jgi:hypothetical protein
VEPHPKWRVKRTPLGRWKVDEWDGLNWKPIAVKFKDMRDASDFMHANAIVECAMDNEDWKLL